MDTTVLPSMVLTSLHTQQCKCLFCLSEDLSIWFSFAFPLVSVGLCLRAIYISELTVHNLSIFLLGYYSLFLGFIYILGRLALYPWYDLETFPPGYPLSFDLLMCFFLFTMHDSFLCKIYQSFVLNHRVIIESSIFI